MEILDHYVNNSAQHWGLFFKASYITICSSDCSKIGKILYYDIINPLT